MLSGFNTILERDMKLERHRWMDRRTDRQNCHINIVHADARQKCIRVDNLTFRLSRCLIDSWLSNVCSDVLRTVVTRWRHEAILQQSLNSWVTFFILSHSVGLTRPRLSCHIWKPIMQLGQPQPAAFANRTETLVGRVIRHVMSLM